MAAAPKGSDTATGSRGDLSPHARAHVRVALTGSIFAMSVLAYLGDHDTSLGKAVLTVAGTGLVIFFGEAYAGLFSMAAAPGVLAGGFLLLADLFGLPVSTAVDIALWAGVVTLTVCSVVEARSSHRSPLVRVGSVV